MFKRYQTDHFEDILTTINFPNYEKFKDTTNIMPINIIIQKFTVATDKSEKGK